MRQFVDNLLFSLVSRLADIQQSLSAKHTAYYLSVESLFYGLTINSLLVASGLLLPFELIFLSLSYVVFAVSAYVVLRARKDSSTPAVAELSFLTVIILILISVVPLLFGYAIRRSEIVPLVGLVSLLIYLIALQYRNKRYLGVPDFFVNKYSEAYNEWVEASVALEKAMANTDNSKFKSYYWSLRAENSYRRAAVADSLELRNIATEFESVASLVSAAMVADEDSKNMYMSEAYVTLSRAISKSKKRLCDKCGRQVRMGSISSSQINKFENICGHCRISKTDEAEQYRTRDTKTSQSSRFGSPFSGKTNQRTKRKQKWDEWQRDAHRKGHTQYRKSSQKEENTDFEQEEDLIDISESCEILDVSSDVNDVDTIASAFREKVKEVHPDAGGSTEEFKQVKSARDTLMNNIRK